MLVSRQLKLLSNQAASQLPRRFGKVYGSVLFPTTAGVSYTVAVEKRKYLCGVKYLEWCYCLLILGNQIKKECAKVVEMSRFIYIYISRRKEEKQYKNVRTA